MNTKNMVFRTLLLLGGVALWVTTGQTRVQDTLDAASPLTVITSEQVENMGVTKMEDLINRLPNVTQNGLPGVTQNGSPGVTPNLRGLGADRTLILINGRRVAGQGVPLEDAAERGFLNAIPVAISERVDILRDSSAAMYGSDAIAGVVNFIIKEDNVRTQPLPSRVLNNFTRSFGTDLSFAMDYAALNYGSYDDAATGGFCDFTS